MTTTAPLDPASGHSTQTIWLHAPGARLHAWIVTPASPQPWPLTVMAHGWAAVKEMNLDYFAAAMCDRGLAVLVFDHRGFGASEGLRGDIDPQQQIADYRFAISVGESIVGVDPERIGVWGTSYSGGHVLSVVARDDRVRAAVAQVPTISGSIVSRRRYGDEGVEQMRRDWLAERERLAQGLPPRLIPAADLQGRTIHGGEDPEEFEPVAPERLPPAPDRVYRDDERGLFYAELPEERRRTWRNRVTMLSLERYASYNPGHELRAPSIPLLVIYADADTITPADLIRQAVAGWGPNVTPLELAGGHYAVYGAARTRAAAEAAEFLAAALG